MRKFWRFFTRVSLSFQQNKERRKFKIRARHFFSRAREEKHARANKRLPAPPPLRDKELQRERSRAKQPNLSPTNFKVTSSSRFR